MVVVMERTGNELCGISCLDMEEVAPPKKQIMSSRSFGTMVTTINELGEAVATYVARAAEKLRQQGAVCGAIHVFIRTNPFRERELQYSNGIVIALPDPSNDSMMLTKAALFGLEQLFREGYQYKKADVMLMALTDAASRQGTLFDDGAGDVRAVKLMGVVDALNRQHGRDTVQLGAAGIQARWAMPCALTIVRQSTRPAGMKCLVCGPGESNINTTWSQPSHISSICFAGFRLYRIGRGSWSLAEPDPASNLR